MVTSLFRLDRQKLTIWLVSLLVVLVGTIGMCSFLFRQQTNLAGDVRLHYFTTHDSLWHIALMTTLKQGFPPENPIYAGEPLTGYHYFHDALLVGVHLLTGISLWNLYLWVSPVVLAAGIAASAIWLGRTLKWSWSESWLLSLLVTTGSGLAWFGSWWHQVSFRQSLYWLDQPVQLLINQQLGLSLLVLILVLGWFKNRHHWQWWIGLGLLAGSLAGIKVYAAGIVLPALLVVGLWEAVWRKRLSTLWMSLVSLLVASSIMYLNPSHLGWPFIWAPGWFIKTMFESGSHLNYPTWEIHRLLFIETSNYPRLIWKWATGGAYFFAGNFGLKILGLALLPFAVWIGERKRLNKFLNSEEFVHVLLWSLLVGGSFLAPTLFIQKGIVWNTIQFLHYAAVPLCLLLIWSIRHLTTNQNIRLSLLAAVWVLSTPTTLMTMINNSDQQFDDFLIIRADTIYQWQQFRNQIDGEATVMLEPQGASNALGVILLEQPLYWADPTILAILGLDDPARPEHVTGLLSGTSKECPANSWIVWKDGDELVMKPCLEVVTTPPLMPPDQP